MMVVELVNTGTELMLGRVLNTHQHWLCRQLSDLGYAVARQIAVPDASREIESAVREALTRADLIIVTGGLGPTSDDRTREAVAALLGRKLREDSDTLARMESWFAARNRSMPPSARVQALVFEGADVLPNLHGTAPGIAVHVKPNSFRKNGSESWLFLLPGPRRELKPMFADRVVPRLRGILPEEQRLYCRVLRTTGLPESIVEQRIEGPLDGLVREGLELGYSAQPGQVDVRLAAHGHGAENIVERADIRVRAELESAVFGIGDETLEEVVVRLLEGRTKTLAVAESCTGGNIAHRLTNIPGASVVFRCGWVTYSNESKHRLLGVRTESLDQFGAVSEEVAREMAVGACRAARTDYAIAVTGIAGPTGGTPEKPLGTVFIALASPEAVEVTRWLNLWDRTTFKEVTSHQALNQLRLELQKTR
jgi:competence/damage-inducible protein CinA-like protein